MSMKKSSDIPEYNIFEAFVKHDNYNDALAELERYDQEHKDSKIFTSVKLKKSLQYSFNLFREIMRDEKLSNNIDEFVKEDVFNTLTSELKERMFPFMSHRSDMTDFGVSKAKINVGMLLLEYANFMNDGGKLIVNEYKRQQERSRLSHEQPRVSKYGNVGYGGYGNGNVFTPVSRTHKSLRERIFENKR